MRTTMRASQESSAKAGASDPRPGPTRMRSVPNPQPGAVAGARAAYTRPTRPLPIYGPPSALRTEDNHNNTAQEQCVQQSRSIMPAIRAVRDTVRRTASEARISFREIVRANRHRRPYPYVDNMVGGQGTSRISAFDDLATDPEPELVYRDQPAIDAFADVAERVRQPVPAPLLQVNEAALAALEGRPPPREYELRRDVIATIDSATARRHRVIRRRAVTPETPFPTPPPLYSRPPTYRSCLSSGRPSCKDVSFEDNHDKHVTLWDMAAPDLERTPDNSPTPTLTAASTPGNTLPPPCKLINLRTVNLNKPLPDSPESSFEWPAGYIPTSIAVQAGYVTKEAAAAAKAASPYRKQFVKAPAGSKPW